MINRIVFQVLGLCTIAQVSGQSPEIGLEIGYGHYKMSNLSEFIIYTREKVPLDTRVVYDYPPYLYYQPEILWGNGNFSVGMVMAFQSTGSRISVKDYSGEYRLDSRVKSNAPALVYKQKILGIRGIQWRLSAAAGMVFTKMVLEEFLELDNQKEFEDSFKFHSTSAFVEPGTSISYTYRFAILAMNLGYFHEFRISPLEEEESGRYIDIPLKGRVQSEWSGIRLGVGLTFHLPRKYNEN